MRRTFLSTLLALLTAATSGAQTLVQPVGPIPPPPAPPAAWSPPPRVVVPQMGRVVGRSSALDITAIRGKVEIRDAVASTTIEVSLANRSGANQEAVIMLPVPVGATVVGFTFEGPANEPTARLLTREEARREYDSIVARERDPALLEWAGWNLIRSSVFPVPPGGTQRVQVTFEQLLESVGDRIDYVLPRSDMSRGPAWSIEIDITSHSVLAAVYSPTHELRTVRRDEHSARLVATDRGAAATGALRLSIVRGVGLNASVLAYPDPAVGGGYFLLLAAAPPGLANESLARDLVLVLDRSGSMSGAPLEQAKLAALRIVDGMRDGERINVIDFSNGISKLADQPLILDPATRGTTRDYIAGLQPSGGTNIHDALLEALRQQPAAGSLPLCLFLTDGLPTIGKTIERDIRAMAESANGAKRRIFTVGVGPDVNVPLLDRLADASRAVATYVTQGDDLTAKVGDIADRLKGPVIADIMMNATEGRAPAPGRIAETLPAVLPDLFLGSTLVVLGQYRGEAPFTIGISGNGRDGVRAMTAQVDPRAASTANAFVPRLWASRRIAQLIDGIRQLGADGHTAALDSDPRLRELVGEIVRLSATWGILTEYTSMLALEGSRFNDWRALEAACADSINGRAVQTRSGYDAVNQGINFNRQKLESNLAGTKGYVNSQLTAVEAPSMAQCGDKNLWRQGSRWVDGSLAGVETPQVDEEVLFGSDRHRQLLWELVDEGRQSAIALDGEVLLRHRGKTYLVRNVIQ
ncbi:MAG: VWA domain-containing protein [Phycisphaerae bacterium]|nr:VWA domain-containing protein [Phycisphaerae bacterium]